MFPPWYILRILTAIIVSRVGVLCLGEGLVIWHKVVGAAYLKVHGTLSKLTFILVLRG